MTALPIARKTPRRLLLSTAAPLVIGLALAGQAQAQNTPTPSNPAGWTNVTPGTTVGNDSSVNVTGNRAYATWFNFNVIGGTFTVNGQANPSWILVNRVTGTDASLISGTIQANGQVWLINQNGITATSSAVFDVGGLLLSTAQVFDPNVFLAGGTSWNFDNAFADIVMNGTVNATGGVVALIAPDVSMGGRINEGAGSAEVLLLAAQSASLTFSDANGDLLYELNNVTVTRGADDARVAVGTGGAVTADRIVIGAVANGGAGRILISGGLSATGARGDGRDIVLTVADQTAGFAGPDAERVIYGAAMPVAPTTTTGGTITLNDGASFSTAAGGGMEVSAAGNVTFGTITTALDDLDVLATGDFTSGVLTVRRDALVAAGGAVSTGPITAGRDVSLVGSSVTAGALRGGRDILVRALTGDVTLGSAAAGDDLWIEAAESITTGALTAGTGADGAGVADRPGAGLFGGVADQTGGGDIVVRAGDDITIGDATAAGAGGDVRVRSAAGAATTGAVTAGADIAIDATDVTTAALSAGRDIGLRARTGDLTLGAARAGDDIVLRGARIATGALTTDGTDDASAGQAGDLLSGLDPFVLDGTRSVAGGADVDVRATDAIATGAVSAGRDARLQTPSTIATGAVRAGRDVLLDATDIAAGALTAGRDVAAWARTGTLTTGAIAAGDDVVLRAPDAILVTGGITAGGGADAAGEADLLATLAPATMFGTARDLTGADVDLSSGAALTVTGAVATTGPESDVRANAVDGIVLGGASAGRDVSLDGPTIETGALSAGRDVAVWARAGALTTGAIAAGDDVVLRAPDAIQVNGGITAGSGADAAGDGDLVATLSPATMFGTARDLIGADVDLSSGAALTVTGAIATSGAQSDVRANAVDGITLGGASAGRDVSLDGPTITTGALSAGRDVAAWARTGALTTGAISAGDDVVLRAPAVIRVNGGIAAGAGADAIGDGDLVATLSPATMFGTARDLTGADVDLSSGAALTVTGAVATTGAESDVRANAVDGIALGGASAGRDVSLDGPRITTGAVSAGRDVAIWARTGTLTAGAIAAGDDVVLRAPGLIRVDGGITAGGGTDAVGDGDRVATLSPATMFGMTRDLTGSDVDLASGAGVTVTGTAAAGGAESDVRVNAIDGIALGGASAGRDVSLDGPTITTGALSAGRDVAAWARTGTLTTGAIAAGDDVVLRAPGAVQVNGGITAGSGPDAAGDGDVVAAQSPSAMFGTLNALTGGDVDLSSGAGLVVTGAVATTGAEADVRANAVLGIALGGASAGRDVSLDGPTITTGALSAGRDVAAWARTGTLTTGGITAGDDVVLRAPGAILVNGAIAAGGGADAAGDGDVVAGLVPSAMFGTVRDLTGSDVDLSSGAGLTVTGAVSAAGAQSDVRVNAVDGIALGGASAGRDLSLDGPTIVAGALSAGRDVAARARAGALTTGGIVAGDDVVLRAPGAILVSGGITAGAGSDAAGDGDVLATLVPSAMLGTVRDLAGADIDLASGATLTVTGTVATTGGQSDLRVNAGSGITLAEASAGGDVSLDGPTIRTGALSAGRDVAAWARTGTLTTGGIVAGDDVVLRGLGAVQVNGGIATGAGPDTAGDGDVLATLSPSAMFGMARNLTGADVDLSSGAGLTVTGPIVATGAESDLRGNAVGGIALGGASAGRDLSLDGPTITTGTLSAGRDVAAWARTGALTTGGITAGDDVVLRAPGAIQVNGGIATGAGADAAGDADIVATLSPSATFGTVRDLAGADVDLSSGAGLTVTGPIVAAGTASDLRANAVGGIALGGAAAGRDVSLDGTTLVAGAVTAGRDVAARARAGGMTLGSARAGDDVVLRAGAGAVLVTGELSAGTGVEATGDGDVLAALVPTSVFGVVNDLSGGSDVDVSARDSIEVRGATSALGTGSDVRASTAATGGQAVLMADVRAGRDVSLDGARVTGGVVAAGRDVAIRGRTGDVTLGSVNAGDDIVVRALGGAVTATGGLTATGTVDQAGSADLLAGLSPAALFGVTHGLTGSDIDLSAATIAVTGETSARSDVRAQATGALRMGAISATENLGIDAASVEAGVVSAGTDIAIRARSGNVTATSLTAADDVVVRASGDLRVNGVTSASGREDIAGVGDDLARVVPSSLFGVTHLLTGGDIDLSAAAITITGRTSASNDVRGQATGAIQVAAVNSAGEIALDGASISAGEISTTGDVALRARAGDLTAESVSAGDDAVLRASGAVRINGGLVTTARSDGAGVGDALATLIPAGLFGVTHALTGSDIDISGGTVSISGATTATGATGDVRAQGTGTVQTGAITAGGDIGLDGTAITAGALSAGRDVGLRARAGNLVLASATAGDDIVLRASGAVTASGALTATAAGEAAGVADALSALAPAALFGSTAALTGSDVDISGGTVGLAGVTTATGAGNDVRAQATGGVQTGAITAGGDIGLDGGSVSARALAAGRDVGLRARAGDLVLASVAAGDDIVLRASGAVTASGALTAGGGADGAGVADVLATLVPGTLFGLTPTLAGSDVDVAAASGGIAGPVVATGAGADVRIRTSGGLLLGSVTAGGDIALDGASVTAAGLRADRDVAVRAGNGELRLTSVSAGDDIVLRASGALVVTGAVASTGLLDEAGTGDALRPLNPGTSLIALSGRASTGSDIDILAGTLTLNGVSTAGAGSDVRLETSGATRGQLQVSGPITASGTGSSVLIHGGDTRLGAVTARTLRLAGSDIALNGAVSVVGDMDVFADTAGTVILGGVPGTGSFRLDNSEMQRVSAGRFSLFASTPLTATTRTTSGNVVVDTLELRPTLNSVGVYVDGRRIDVVGAVTGAGGSFTLGSAVPIEGFDWRPSVVRVSSTIGTPAARLGSVAINGDSIFIAPREGTSTAGQPDAFELGTAPVTNYLGGPGLIAPGGVQIAADTLTLRARDRILQRNLQGDPRNLSDGRGFDVGSLIIDRLGTTDIASIDLFGQFRAPGVPVIGGVGAALAVQFGGTGSFRLNYVPTSADTIDGYRLNTCIFGAGGGCAVFLTPFSQPPIADPDELGDLVDPFAVVDDEPVTSSGGEILWPAPGERNPDDEEDEDEQ